MSDYIVKDCAHAVCGEWCEYAPPPIGPTLPGQIRDVDGGLWTRHNRDLNGCVFYLRKPDGGYEIATWSGIQRRYYTDERFPEGPWVVVLDGDWRVVEAA